MILATIVYMNNTLGGRVLLARRVGISRPFISDIERGKTTNVGVETIHALAQALGVRPAYLLGVSDVMVDEDNEDGVLYEGRAVYLVDDEEERKLLQELLELFQKLNGADQRLALSMMRRIGGADVARVIGDE